MLYRSPHVRRIKRILAGLFDLDGTIADTEEILPSVWSEEVAKRGHDFSAFDYTRIIGRPDLECARIVLDHFGIAEAPEAFYAGFQRRLYERLPTELAPRPGAEKVLRTFRAGSLPRGLVTSASAHHADVALDALGYRREFRAVVTAEDRELKARKPEPDPYLLCARRLGIAPHECVVFEDSPSGVLSAKRAGMTVVAVPHRHSPIEKLMPSKPDIVLADIGEFRFDMLFA
jgi:pseudouridine-5'-monophosphatase